MKRPDIVQNKIIRIIQIQYEVTWTDKKEEVLTGLETGTLNGSDTLSAVNIEEGRKETVW